MSSNEPAVWPEIVRLAYRGVLRREIGSAELTRVVAELSAGDTSIQDLLATLVDSEEAREMRLAPRYDSRSDTRLTPFFTADVAAFSKRLEHEQPVDRAGFEEAWRIRFDEELGHEPVEEDHRAYGLDHAKRFFETVNAMQILRGEREPWRVLDFGLSVFSAMYKRIFPDLDLCTSDRPVDAAHLEFFERGSRAAGASSHFSNDLNDAEFLSPAKLQAMGQFDLILLTEVLEHLTVHPVSLLRQIAQLLTPDGALYLTTPNFFSSHHLSETERRINPQPIFPVKGNSDTHYHYREYCMSELLQYLTEAGLAVTGFYFSDCWESDELAAELEHRPDERSNLVVTARLEKST